MKVAGDQMPFGKWTTLFGIFAALLTITACSPVSVGAENDDRRRVAGTPTESELRAAALLSLSNNSTLESKGPYEQAVSCIGALDSLQERFDQVGALDRNARSSMRLARTLYERKASAQKAQSSAGLIKDVEAARAASDDPGLQARTAISCLRKLR